MENQKVKWLVQGHTLTFIWPHYLVKMLLLYQTIMPLFYTGILIKNNCVPVSSFWNFLLQKTWSIASQWAEWRFWLAPKSYTFCWASMPSSADLQRQPLVPNTGKFTWSIDHITMPMKIMKWNMRQWDPCIGMALFSLEKEILKRFYFLFKVSKRFLHFLFLFEFV